ncbi:MAG: molecular chaperone TorD family protein [Planctomycetota bacterium]|jgi:nitrate reductase assembly molybdenum cofactor insertion protein NarJ|nr:molecular chaperone TorD family protein [Planctomycetota bacterium]
MRPAPEVHDALACLLTYPGEGGGSERYAAAADVVSRSLPDCAEELRAFLAGIGELGDGELEELYTHTFDNVADRSLEVGWQLFGENYARGVLMVRLRGLMREHGITEHTELPDHLTHVLALLGHLPEDLAGALARNQVHQAAEKIHENLRAITSPWAGVLAVTLRVLESHSSPTCAEQEATR